MASAQLNSAAHASRRPARDLIDAVVDNMRKNLEPLKYSTLTPTRFTVYMHPTEYARLEGIIPILESQTRQALTEELQGLNRRSQITQWFKRIARDRQPQIDNGGAAWQVEFRPDPDGDMHEGDLLIDSELALPARPELGVGERTRRITTVHTASHQTTTREQTVNRVPQPTVSPVFARITFDDTSGPHAHDVCKDSVTIGRGGIAYPVDIRIAAAVDVSREHARIRRDPTGRFYLIDLSSLGTTLNGRHVPRGYEEHEGAKRENGVETLLPDTARIGLADMVFLDFKKAD